MNDVIESYGFTEARNNLTSLIDAAQSNRPQRIKRRKKSEDEVLVITETMLKSALSEAGRQRVSVALFEDDNNSWTATMEPFGLAGNAPSESEAVSQMLGDVRLYAEEYMKRISLYLQSPNRRRHFPLILQILLCATDDELKKLLRLA